MASPHVAGVAIRCYAVNACRATDRSSMYELLDLAINYYWSNPTYAWVNPYYYTYYGYLIPGDRW